jgi:hypothetical protein
VCINRSVTDQSNVSRDCAQRNRLVTWLYLTVPGIVQTGNRMATEEQVQREAGVCRGSM